MSTKKFLLYTILTIHFAFWGSQFSEMLAQDAKKLKISTKLRIESNTTDQTVNNYKNKSYVLDSGGDIANSTDYRTLNSIGQPSPIGIARSASFTNSPGFIPTIRMKYKIAGKVIYALTGNPIRKVTMFLSGAESAQVNTNDSGYYELTDLQDGLSYLVIPKKYNDYNRKITITLKDAFRVYCYLNNSLQFDYYEWLASDIDENEAVDKTDEELIRKRALGNTDTVKNHSGQWRFQPDKFSYSPLLSDTANQNYRSVLLGDNDGSWKIQEESLNKELIKELTYSGFPDMSVNNDSIVTIPLSIQDTSCFQFAEIKLNYDPEILTFLKCQQTELSEDFYLMTFNDTCQGEISTALFAPSSVELHGEILHFRFKVVGKEGESSQLVLQKFRINEGPIMKASAKLTIDSPRAFPKQYQLHQNFPNPFNSITVIRYDLANSKAYRTELMIYNICGQLVKTVVDRVQEGGFYQINWDGTNESGEKVASGLYIYRLSSGTFHKTRKLVILK